MDISKWLRLQVDRVGAVGCVLVGALVLLVGWIGVSSHAYPAEQLPYIASAGLGGLFLLGVGATLWLSADLLDEWHKLDHLEQELRKQTAIMSSGSDAPSQRFYGDFEVDPEAAAQLATSQVVQEPAARSPRASARKQTSLRAGSPGRSRG